jgi:hypothetical protein
VSEEKPRVSLLIAGIPAPKGSRTVGTRKNGTHYTRESSPVVKSWVEAVAYSARANRPGGKALEPPYEVDLAFSLPRPGKPSHDWPSTCDTDKLKRPEPMRSPPARALVADGLPFPKTRVAGQGRLVLSRGSFARSADHWPRASSERSRYA